MYFHALATDYDGTLAHAGRIDKGVVAALEKFHESGRKLILVTGRVIKDLLATCPCENLFDCIVGENGAVLYWPATRQSKSLSAPLPASFIEELHRLKVSPLDIGEVLAATVQPNETKVLAAIRQQGLELQMIFNKGAVMILPSGINKGTGLQAALQQLGLSRHNVVGVGDAENDHVFLQLCECAAAVANALPSIKEQSDLCLGLPNGAGVAELIDHILADDLASCHSLPRHRIPLGTTVDGQIVAVSSRKTRLLFCGPSGSGKSTLATALLENLAEQQYQFCLIDPEGDYEQFEGAVTLAGPHRSPDVNEAIMALANPSQNLIINLVGVPLDERPTFLARFYPMVQKMRDDTGRPHWLFIDEAHHMMPAGEPAAFSLGAPDDSVIVTASPASIHPNILRSIDVIVATDSHNIDDFCLTIGEPPPEHAADEAHKEAVVWFRSEGRTPIKINPIRSNTTRLRHRRKYAEGELPPDRSFYFRGAEQKLNLRADNLRHFIQLAAGVDKDTWQFHLRRHDYSRWIREALKDQGLADEIQKIEETAQFDDEESRTLVKTAIERRYTVPAD